MSKPTIFVVGSISIYNIHIYTHYVCTYNVLPRSYVFWLIHPIV